MDSLHCFLLAQEYSAGQIVSCFCIPLQCIADCFGVYVYGVYVECVVFSLGYGLDSIHEIPDLVAAVQKAEAIFIGKY